MRFIAMKYTVGIWFSHCIDSNARERNIDTTRFARGKDRASRMSRTDLPTSLEEKTIQDMISARTARKTRAYWKVEVINNAK